ncbi:MULTISPECIES: hypothetical protein [Vibrio]|nr:MULTISPECIES: hypothetical protein [Vibrio]EHY8704899.1 hypothetical protein [Vibrio cholerae]AMG02355.1 hypothetical protein AL543_04895 [Vibrio mimicus]AMG02397.1 hypothetical protein AL543_05145 [Vibrio mimicus]RBM25433.1 hypothetical protein DLR61_18045 [Vibrio tarriae]HDI3200819.1 hypothetical protein [Vibrio cholerae]
MNIIFNLGFLAMIGAALHRYFISVQSGTEFLDIFSIPQGDWKIYGVAFVWFAFAFWNSLLRWKCPKCRSTRYYLHSMEELDRWVGTKNVTEKLNNGGSTNRAVSTTFVKLRKNYCCNGQGCDHSWSSIVKEEKN